MFVATGFMKFSGVAVALSEPDSWTMVTQFAVILSRIAGVRSTHVGCQNKTLVADLSSS